MNKQIIRLSFCIIIFSVLLYKHINKVNQLTSLKLEKPRLEKEVFFLTEDNNRLRYEIDKFENPNNLIKLIRKKEFAHLKHPIMQDILKVKEGIALNKKEQKQNNYSISMPVGAK